MAGTLNQLDIGHARPHLRGLSQTVPGLTSCSHCKWPEVYSEIIFGPELSPPPSTFQTYWLQRQTQSIGGGLS